MLIPSQKCKRQPYKASLLLLNTSKMEEILFAEFYIDSHSVSNVRFFPDTTYYYYRLLDGKDEQLDHSDITVRSHSIRHPL